MKTKHINCIKTKLPNKSAFTIETEEDFPKLNTLSIVSGKKGGGKSVAVTNFIRRCKDKGYFDRVYLITPTFESNRSIWDIMKVEDNDVFEPTVSVLKTIEQLANDERDEYEAYLEKKKLYMKFKKDMKSKSKIFDDDLMSMYVDMGFFDEPPIWKYKDDSHYPRLALVIDDCLGTDLMAKPSAGLVNMGIRHRHLAKGMGISIFMLVQSYCAQGGVARPIRENCSLLLLFKINDENQIKKIREEADLPVTDEEWLAMCKKAHAIPHNFLLLDFAPKSEQQRFRSGWNDYLIPESLENNNEN